MFVFGEKKVGKLHWRIVGNRERGNQGDGVKKRYRNIHINIYLAGCCKSCQAP